MVEQRSPKPRVVGSSPATPARNTMDLKRQKKIRLRKFIMFGVCGFFVLVIFLLIGVFAANNFGNEKNIQTPTASQHDLSGDLPTREIGHKKDPEYEIATDYSHSNDNSGTRGIIYLTFDDGPGPYTARLLDILKANGIKVTFFVTGAGDDSLIRREYDEGHAIGLHTWSHRYEIVYSSVESYFNDLQLVHDRVFNITGLDSRIIRFPGGSSNLVSARYDNGIKIMSILTDEVGKRGYTYFDWNVVSGDAGGATTADEVYNNVTAHLKDGNNVVLQHDIKDFSVDAVERIISYGKSNGFSFEALDQNSPTMHHGVNN